MPPNTLVAEARRAIARHIAQREALAARAINSADWRAALSSLDSAAKPRNLFPDAKELRELLKTLTTQDQRLRELEAQLASARNNDLTTTPSPE